MEEPEKEDEQMYLGNSDENFEKQGARCEGEAEWFVAFLNQINEEGSAMRFKIFAINMVKYDEKKNIIIIT